MYGRQWKLGRCRELENGEREGRGTQKRGMRDKEYEREDKRGTEIKDRARQRDVLKQK